MVALKKDFGGVATELAGTYRGPALVPPAPWLQGAAPPAPQLRLLRQPAENANLLVEVSAGDPSCLLAIWGRYGATWRLFTLPGGGGTLPACLDGQPLDLAFAASVGRTGRESPRVPLGDAR